MVTRAQQGTELVLTVECEDLGDFTAQVRQAATELPLQGRAERLVMTLAAQLEGAVIGPTQLQHFELQGSPAILQLQRAEGGWYQISSRRFTVLFDDQGAL